MATGAAPDLPFGAELVALTDALGSGAPSDPAAERQRLVDAAGPEAAERAIGVIATFQMMNRALDGVGAPVNPHLHPFAIELGFDPNHLPR